MLSSLYSLRLCSYCMTNEPCEMTFPSRLHTCRGGKKQSVRQTDGRMAGPQNYCISPSHLVGKGKEAGANDCLQKKKTTWDRASQLQALRMINGFANPAGLQTQMRTELIAVRNTFGMNGKKNAGRRASERPRKGPVAALELQVGFCLQEFTRRP